MLNSVITKISLYIIGAAVVVGGGVYAVEKVRNPEPEASTEVTANIEADTSAATSDTNASSTLNASTSLSTSVAGSVAVSADASFNTKTSLKDIMSRGGNYKCTFTMQGATANSDGTVYISGDRIRGDFSSVVPQAGLNIQSHMITDGGWVYTWSNMMATGFKMKVAASAQNTGAPAQASQMLDQNQQLDYNCVAWNKDESLFTVPASITFTALN